MSNITYKEKQRQRREEEIMQKAAELLTERGYANLNMDDLADVVGISKPTLYQHFKSKEDLIVRVVLEDLRGLDQQFRRSLSGTPLERLQQTMRVIFKSRFARGSVMSALDHEVVWKIFKSNELIVKGREQFHEKLRLLVEEAQALGEIDPDMPTSIVVRSIFCLQGALSDPALKAELVASEEKLDKAIETVIRLFTRGVAPEHIATPIATATDELLPRN